MNLSTAVRHRLLMVFASALVGLLAIGASAAPSQFFLKIRPWTLTFVKEGSQVTRLDILDSGQVMSGRRVD